MTEKQKRDIRNDVSNELISFDTFIKEDETKEDKVILNRLDDLIKNIQQIKNSIK